MTNGTVRDAQDPREQTPPIERRIEPSAAVEPRATSVLAALGNLHPVTAGTVVLSVTGLTAAAIVSVVALVLSVLTAAVAVAGAVAVALVAAAVIVVVMSR